MNSVVVIIATLSTKFEEAEFLSDCIEQFGIPCRIVDSSIDSRQADLVDEQKIRAMNRAGVKARNEITLISKTRSIPVVVGMGGGTGTQIAVGAMTQLEIDVPKVLITTQAFDSRCVPGVEDAMIIPTVADLEGLNPINRNTLRRAAAAAAGFARAEQLIGKCESVGSAESAAVTALGVTAAGVRQATSLLRGLKLECTIFHANGYGGNSMAWLARTGSFVGILDYTAHELVSLCLDPDTSVSDERFRAPAGCPRVVLPGGVNFLTRIKGNSFGQNCAGRPQYRHSPMFTHVGLTPGEMEELGHSLPDKLGSIISETLIVIPMGGFSSEDRDGGILENRPGREAFANALHGRGLHIVRTDGHLNDPGTAKLAVELFRDLLQSHA